MAEKQILEDFEAHLSNAEDYLNPTPELRARCLAGVITVFDILQKRCRQKQTAPGSSCLQKTTGGSKAKKLNSSSGSDGGGVPTGPLQELYVEGFDLDQIWEQIQLVNQPMVAHLTKQVGKISQWNVEKLTGGRKKNVSVSESDSDGMEPDFEDVVDDEYVSEGEEGGLEESDGDEEEGETKKTRKMAGRRKTVVDDRFFKLSEMEEFLEKMEREQERQRDGKELDSDLESDDSDSLEDNDIDYFAGVLSDNEVGDGSSSETKRAHYNDFFDAPEEEVKVCKTKASRQGRDEVESAEKEGEELDEREEREMEEEGNLYEEEEEEDGFDDGDFSEQLEEEEEEGGEEKAREAAEGVREVLVEVRAPRLTMAEEEEKKQALSSHEKKQLKIKDRIVAMEEANLEEKPWQMTGEATAKSRPANSLLQEVLSFDHMTRPAPVITDETTKTLEDVIKQRIIDEAWDDVERRVKPKEKPYDYSRTRPLDQEKSKLSLAEVYEQEYIKQTQTLEEVKEDERHTVIKEMMKKLFVKLDALSNFHFTPKPPKPEVKIVSNVPAIQMEEVAPVATSDAALLAPEEIQVKSKMPEVGTTEKTDTNRKRERRLKKKQKRLRVAEKKQRDKLVAKLRPGLGNKYTKKSFTKKLREREEEERVDNSLKSSSQFFARLQEEVREQVKGVKAEESRTRRGRTSKSQQYKL